MLRLRPRLLQSCPWCERVPGMSRGEICGYYRGRWMQTLSAWLLLRGRITCTAALPRGNVQQLDEPCERAAMHARRTWFLGPDWQCGTRAMLFWDGMCTTVLALHACMSSFALSCADLRLPPAFLYLCAVLPWTRC